MSEQFVSLLVMFVSGIFFAATIDLFRVCIDQLSLRNIIRKIHRLLELLIWLLLGAFTFYLLFIIKGGQWRLVDPIAQVLGIYSYELLFQKIFRMIGWIILKIILRPMYLVALFFVQVVRAVVMFIFKVIKAFINIIKKIF